MIKTLPDKWIRKAISDAINNIIVDGIIIPTYDLRVTRTVNTDPPQHYILMTTQSNEVDKLDKCEWNWQSQILLDIITSYDLPGNIGSRLLADDILDAVRAATTSLVLDAASGLTIQRYTMSFPSDIVTITKKESIFRKLMRIEFYIS